MPKLPVNQSLCFHQQARNWQEDVQNISLFVKLLSHFDITELMSSIASSGAIDVWKRIRMTGTRLCGD
jgi:hypothetical protein